MKDDDSGICRDSGRYITRRRWRDRRPLRLRDRFVVKRLALAAFVMVVVALVFICVQLLALMT
jgi:hypothetical protein